MEKEIVAQALSFVKALFQNDFSGHDYFHTYRVFKMATHIAERENADVEIVQLAALLHDADDRKLFPDTYATKANARGFLQENGVEEGKIQRILQIIGEISYAGKDSVIPATLEGKCAQDADRLDAIGAIGVARAFAYGGSHDRLLHDPDEKPQMNMGKEEYYNHRSTTINHFYEKLFLLTDMMNTPTAKAIAKERDGYMRGFVAEFMAEWEGLC